MEHPFAPPRAPPKAVVNRTFLRFGRKQKIPIFIENQDLTLFCFSLLWCHRESNQGHKDFQSFALPTELWHHFFFRTTLSFDWDCKGRYFFFTCKLFLKNLQKIFTFLLFEGRNGFIRITFRIFACL